jgi:hypothetical protein
MRALLAALVITLAGNGMAGAEGPLTNADVVKLVRAGLSADTIIAKIEGSATAFTIDIDSLVALAHEKVPDAVIRVMVERATGAPTPTATAQATSATPAAPTPATASSPTPTIAAPPPPPAPPATQAIAPTAAPTSPAPPLWPPEEVPPIVVEDLEHTHAFCTARGDAEIDLNGIRFKPRVKSPLCSQHGFEQTATEFSWRDVSHVCFEFTANGAFTVWFNDGGEAMFRGSRLAIMNLATEIKRVQPELPIRCAP